MSDNQSKSPPQPKQNVFKRLNIYEDEGIALDMKLKILLHNMYFNCDIGDNK